MRVTTPRLQRLVQRVLSNAAARSGRTTLQGVTTSAVTFITRSGGYRSFGISDADILMALRHVVQAEAKFQMDKGLPQAVFGRVLPSAPAPLVQLLRRLPSWITLGDGAYAERVETLGASPQDWEAYANLKLKKAAETMRAADVPQDVARLLAVHGYASLRDILT
jgi:hypothetical protein